MSASLKGILAAALLLIVIALGCKSSGVKPTTPQSNSNVTTAPEKPDDNSIIRSGTGNEKEKPAPGKANVQGKVLYNSKPAANIEVKLCEKFNQYFGGCNGQIYQTKSDANGEYLIKN